MTTGLDAAYAALLAGGDGEGMAFYRKLADAELFLVLETEASGEVMTPRVFEVAGASLLLAFDSEERLGRFAGIAMPYAALPGRVIAGQMVGQEDSELSLGLNLGSGAASEVILPPEALQWLITMLDQAEPEALEAQVERFDPPAVPGRVLAALSDGLRGVERAYLVGVRYRGGRRGHLLALVGIAPAAEAKIARAVTEAMAFSGVEASTIDVVFLAADNGVLARMSGVALVFEGSEPDVMVDAARVGPGLDPLRPPNLR